MQILATHFFAALDQSTPVTPEVLSFRFGKFLAFSVDETSRKAVILLSDLFPA
ncbi:hypothetical protein OHAE_325 [Ochrobactrum soli]|uniref:Uncharacterized protein n=1 Tax=Ochrobactrum soli TaxID=2448455 RepID=A0A2P9HK34_9HYPH|nr:hypothetical protein OHAE_325 [[Ochrobactrum] soli]